MKQLATEFDRIAYAVWSFLFFVNPKETARMANWRAQDIAEMQDADGLDPRAVDKLIGTGMQHRIYEYHADMLYVLKVSTPVPLLRFPSFADAQSDLESIAQFFEPYHIQPTQIIPLKSPRYVIKQRRLARYKTLTPTVLQEPEIRAQFLDIVARNRDMRARIGRSLDFLGREGQRKCRAAFVGLRATPTIANIVVELADDRSRLLRILDTDLEHFLPHAASWQENRSGTAARAAFAINRFFIQHFFGIDID